MTYALRDDLITRFGEREIVDASLAELRYDGHWSASRSYPAGSVVTISDGSYWQAAADLNDSGGVPSSTNPDWDLTDAPQARVEAALLDAGTEIDATLASRYALPLESPYSWPFLIAIQCDIARLRLYDESAPEVVVVRANAARRRLTALGNGDTALVNAAGVRPRRTDAAKTAGPDVIMSKRNLEGYNP